jgi:signal transduction histidine kinase
MATKKASLFSIPTGLKSHSLTKPRLILLMLTLCIIMIVPVLLVTGTALNDIRSESIEQYEQLAEKLQFEIERQLAPSLKQFTQDYDLLSQQVERKENKNLLPGLIGFFQIDYEGEYRSPLIPLNGQKRITLNVSDEELALSQNEVKKVYEILSQNQIVKLNPYTQIEIVAEQEEAPALSGQQPLLKIKAKKESLPSKKSKPAQAKKTQIEQARREKSKPSFKIDVLPTGYLMFHRTAEVQGEWLIEGALVAQQAFFDKFIVTTFNQTPIAEFAELVLNYQGLTLYKYGTNSRLNELASYQLAEPLQTIELTLYYDTLPTKTSALYIQLLALFLILAVVLGLGILYRMLILQTALLQRQQGFISSISHELKTPITAIKMYGDSLQQGWLDDTKKQKYYQHITTEAERLSRLIDNMLQASNISRNAFSVDLQPIQASTIKSLILAKTKVLFEQSGFECHLSLAEEASDAEVLIDTDAFTQVVINLVDNAIKYSNNTDSKRVDITLSKSTNSELLVSIRDYGQGMEEQELSKIFDLFYRVGNELTRTSKGTGLGLTLVKELLELMQGKIYAIKKEQGTEFVVTLPLSR